MIDFDCTEQKDIKDCFSKFYEMIRILRQNCPWDKEQTPETMSRSIQGELYEYMDSLSENDPDHVKEELGDVFLNLFLMLAIHDMEGDFKDTDVLNSAMLKYYGRHPHVFGNANSSSVDQVLQIWEAAKKAEGKNTDDDFFYGIPNSAPELERCYKISKKAAKAGFEWHETEGVYEKIQEELGEVRSARNHDEVEDELGDVLFTVVNLCRHMDVKPQNALRRANIKFEKRFNVLNSLAKERNLVLENLNDDEWNDLWIEAKKIVSENN